MNDWGAIPRHSAKHYNINPTVRKATKYIFRTFLKMKKEIEESQLPEQVKNYEQIKIQLSAMYRTLSDNGVEDDLTKAIKESLNSFMTITGSTEFSIVAWE